MNNMIEEFTMPDSPVLTAEQCEELGLKLESDPLPESAEMQRLEVEFLQSSEELPEEPPEVEASTSEQAQAEEQSEKLSEEQLVELHKVVEELAKLDPLAFANRLNEVVGKYKKYGIGKTELRAAVKNVQMQSNHDSGEQGKEIILADPTLIDEDQARELDGAALLQEVSEVFSQHLTLPKHADTVLALWVVFTWLHDAFPVSPMLAVTSPERECGKTTLLSLLCALTRKPFPSANATVASLFRIVDKHHPTVLADEVDKWLQQSDERIGIINTGWQRCFAKSARVEGEKHEVRMFSVWAPKALAGILTLPEEIAGRSIEIRMRRQTREEGARLKNLRADDWGKFDPLRFKLFNWTQLVLKDDTLRRRDPKLPEGFGNRLADNWRVLFSIAEVAGEEWPDRVREASLAFTARNREESWGETLLQDIWNIFNKRDEDRLLLKQVVLELLLLEERPWSECNRGKAITSIWLSNKLRGFGIVSRDMRTPTGEKGNGYFKEDFDEPIRRYCKNKPDDEQDSQGDECTA